MGLYLITYWIFLKNWNKGYSLRNADFDLPRSPSAGYANTLLEIMVSTFGRD